MKSIHSTLIDRLLHDKHLDEKERTQLLEALRGDSEAWAEYQRLAEVEKALSKALRTPKVSPDLDARLRRRLGLPTKNGGRIAANLEQHSDQFRQTREASPSSHWLADLTARVVDSIVQKPLRGEITRQQHDRRPRGDVFTLCRAWQESNSTEFDAELFADSWTRFEESGMLQEGRPLEFVGSLPTEGQALGGGDRPPGFETLLITLAANVVWDYRKRGEKLLGEKREKAIKRHLKLVGNISPHEERARRVLNFLLDTLAARQP